LLTPIDLDQVPDAERYFIYGAGVTGITTHGLLAARGCLVAGYFDTFKTGEVNFLRCRPPDEIASIVKPGDLIVIASVYYMEIEKILRSLGVGTYINGTMLSGPATHKETMMTRRFVNRFVAPGGITLDVGANIGDTAILFARRARHVYAFEPNPELFERFISVTEGYNNITLVPYAASDRQQKLPLNISSLDLTATASSLDRSTGRSIDIECVTLDAWCADKGVIPSFVKIDAEGHDLAVIRGALELIARHRPTMLVEATGTEAECRAFDEFSADYRIIRVPSIDDPYWHRDYLDAIPFYRDHVCTEPVNIGFIPLTT
jgi:FkbM family methyltransferase